MRPRRHPFLLRHSAHNENKPTRSQVRVRSDIQGPGLRAHPGRGAHGPNMPCPWISLAANDLCVVLPGPAIPFLRAAQRSSSSVAGSRRSHCVRSLDPPPPPPFLLPFSALLPCGEEEKGKCFCPHFFFFFSMLKPAPDLQGCQEDYYSWIWNRQIAVFMQNMKRESE